MQPHGSCDEMVAHGFELQYAESSFGSVSQFHYGGRVGDRPDPFD
jgi:hypothetical protein